MIPEIIRWHPVSERLPDDNETVLTLAPEAAEPVSVGFYENGQWVAIDGSFYDNADEIPHSVKAWASMPEGRL